jgi:hypothetical protein
MGGVSTLIDDEMMTVIDALDGRRQGLILICSQFLLEEQHEDERDQHTASSVRANLLLVGQQDGISPTRREVVKLGAVGAPSVAQLNNLRSSNSSDAPNRRAPVGQQSNATIVRSHR